MKNKNTFSAPICDPAINDCHFVGAAKLVNDKEIKFAACLKGAGGCFSPAKLLQARESEMHTAELIKATNAINKILANIPEHPTCGLTILHLKQGTLLAWVEHGGTEIKDGITADSDPALVAEHFNLI